MSKMPRSTSIEAPPDNSAADWIEPELSGELGSVTGVVPDRFEAYVRILHPAFSADGSLTRWSEVGAALGREVHALRQWHVLVGATDPDAVHGSEWDGSSPERGDLEDEVLIPLLKVLGTHTADPERCFFGLWTGWAWSWSIALPVDSRESASHFRSVPARSVEEINAPRLELPGRDYVILTGPVSAAAQVRGRADKPDGDFSPNSPNLMWPADRAWFLGSEIDFDSTLVGGSSELCRAIIDADEIEAWPIGPDDLLTADADDQS